MAQSLVNLAFNEQWRFVPPEKDGVQYRKDTSNMECSYRLIRSSVILKCTPTEMATIMNHQSTEAMRSFMRKIMGKTFIDGMVLYAITPSMDNNATVDTTITDEFVTIKWGVLDAGLGVRRDMCVIDLVGDTVVPNTPEKEPLHMWCMTSTDGHNVGCMSLKDSHGIARTEISKLGFFWHKLSRDELEVVVCGSFKSKNVKPVAMGIVTALQRLGDILEDLRLSYQNYADRSTWVKDCDRSGCILCMRTFHTLRRKHHCRMCGDLICSDCSVVKVVNLAVIGSSKLRLCKVCCIRAKSTPVVPTSMPVSIGHDFSLEKEGLSAMDSARSRGFTNQMSFDSGSPVSPSQLSSSEYDNDDMRIDHFSTKGICGEIMRLSITRLTSVPLHEDPPKQQQVRESTVLLTPATPPPVHKRHIEHISLKHASTGSFSTATRENSFELLCDLACEALNCPIAVVCLLDGPNEKVKSLVGLDNSALQIEIATFVDKVMGLSPIVVLDAAADNLSLAIFDRVPVLRFFAGCPIFGRTGKYIGYICVADTRKRTQLGSSCAFTMERLASLAATTMEAHNTSAEVVCPAPSALGDSTELRMRDLLLKSYMTQQQIATQNIMR
ncbi:hypothetical protein DYB32_001715 [Aphanomyces invadans]|uniref:FYVE-type domain-containing protein n=1 Tax=Aphanomyces invadans TaxID=157072 RepID=A0A418B5F2_9STRA|nr:hypothetical protein DYB32_001715 [Aphanomyces invadans]